jgi:hypothetical protein
MRSWRLCFPASNAPFVPVGLPLVVVWVCFFLVLLGLMLSLYLCFVALWDPP